MSAVSLVSVVIPAHNAGKTLGRALDSVLIQDYPAREIVVVDDCSGDDTAAVAARYVGRGVQLIALPHNQGASAARNAGVEAAGGEYVAFLDADDEWLPGKLSRQVAIIEANPRVTIVSCGGQLVSPAGQRSPLYVGRPPVTGPQAWRTLLAYNFIATPSVLARRSDLLQLGGFDPALRVAEDQDLWIKLTMRGELGYAAEPLILVHQTPNSLSSNAASQALRYTMPMVLRHIEAKRHMLSPREIHAILGCRLAGIGRTAYASGDVADGFKCILQAMRHKYRLFDNFLYLMRAAPPVLWLKRKLRPGR